MKDRDHPKVVFLQEQESYQMEGHMKVQWWGNFVNGVAIPDE